MTSILFMIIVTSIAGCVAHHAEKIQWNDKGQKVSQVRTGEVAVAYWFGWEHFTIKDDPNSFEVGLTGYQAKPDPNTIEAAGKVIGTSINTMGGL